MIGWRGAAAGVALCVLLVSAVSACGGSAKPVAGPATVTITLTNSGCTVDHAKVPAGPVTFDVDNFAATTVSEAELIGSNMILAERENVLAGFKAEFAYDLAAGSYSINCPTGNRDHTVPLAVTGVAPVETASVTGVSVELATATDGYVTYVQGQVGALQHTAKTLDDAVRAGDLAAAEAAYPVARVYYERIEPVAESFGDLDPLIDDRVDDAGSLAKLQGFHRLEYAMYEAHSLAGMTPIADGLDANIRRLSSLVATLIVQPTTLANGATALLDEVGRTKITGEEERYSHIDLVDFVANVAGAEEAYDLLRPALRTLQPSLVTEIDARFAALDAALAAHMTGPAPSDYASYSTISAATRRTLAQLVDALAAPLSQVAGAVVVA